MKSFSDGEIPFYGCIDIQKYMSPVTFLRTLDDLSKSNFINFTSRGEMLPEVGLI